MDGQTDGLTDEYADRLMDGWRDDKHAGGNMDIRTNKQLESVAKISNFHYIEAFQCIGKPIH